MQKIYLAFGSNLGDRLGYISAAICSLEKAGIKLLNVSSVYESEPYGFIEQSAFLNCVGSFEYRGTPEELLDTTMGIEQKLLRTREIHWGPRTIDIDVLLFGTMIYNSKRLTIPHYDMKNRSFVLVPLLEIAPDIVEPGTGISYSEYYKKLEASIGLKLIEPADTFYKKLKLGCLITSTKGGLYE
ncbi:2-amino-4-hydroxy-6-hydroxymethyldihydropteridine diphosphokinase [Kosmotoga pacifica]|uniref:2-amino-4-hydroxy-6-hydroxymethyldihydropteridine diphosphokinase n=1 Tax=Kosmotoga pacifica TaxID=1330330 RepID=A0A0G2Z9T5_9BACT|nr:2-amino-4-hydroxy-6-hydroxymethyldihydropteridine diphosphokinase [Kosmotoga pacifica]AKI96851.1 hypothetical protein IX53_02345 [Kosmotoga pacifica]